MAKSKVEIESLELQKMISIYTKESFVCFFADFIRNHSIRPYCGFSKNLKSKYRDSLYLIALRLSSDTDGEKDLYFSRKNDDYLSGIVEKLNEILYIYLEENFSPDYLKKLDDKTKLLIHESTFMNYFQNGKLNYLEQEINHIVRLFQPYKEKILKRLGISLDDLLNISRYLEELFKKKSIESQAFVFSDEFQVLHKKLYNGSISKEEFEKKFYDLPDAFFDFLNSPHEPFLFKKEDITEKFESTVVDTFCDLFSINIEDQLNHIFYTQENPLENRPIIKLSNGKFIHIYQKHIPTAIYYKLFQTVGKSKKELDHLISRRGKKVFENQVETILSKFFSNERNYKIYRNYYIENSNNEKDILVVSKYNAFIIECKASKFREPLRDLEKAFIRIQSDFKSSIQNGYDQCMEVEDAMLQNNAIEISMNKKSESTVIDTSSIREIFSIVVTLERFGPVQTNLGFLLQREHNEDPYPWVSYIDDFETFLLTLKKLRNNHIKSFIEFLKLRESFHERLLAQDELDVCAIYLKNPAKFKKLANSDLYIVPDPTLQNYFDQLYYSKKITFPSLLSETST